MQFLGFPASESLYMAELMHRHGYVSPGTPERTQLMLEMDQLRERIWREAEHRRAEPGKDFLSFLANLQIDGELMPLQEVTDNAWLIISGGVDTTTALLSHTFVHLTEHPEYRRRLLPEPESSAFDEYLASSIQFRDLVARSPGSVSWEDSSWQRTTVSGCCGLRQSRPTAIRHPGRVSHRSVAEPALAFGIGIHRCIGANIAQVTWRTVVRSVLPACPM